MVSWSHHLIQSYETSRCNPVRKQQAILVCFTVFTVMKPNLDSCVFFDRLDFLLLPDMQFGLLYFVDFVLSFLSSVFVTRRLQDANSVTGNKLPQYIASNFAVQKMQCISAESWGAL